MPVVKRTLMLLTLFAATTLSCMRSCSAADLRLSKLFSDNMVLQRDKPVAVWGWADPGDKITVKFNDKEASATVDDKGAWSVKIGPLAAGGPFEMTVTGKTTIKVKNILVGEVWICSGQSNMEFGMTGTKNFMAEAAAANFPQIRHFHVERGTSFIPLTEVSGNWNVCTPQTVGGFTAVGYFFARHLHQTLNVPVGLIHASWGGTPAEAWTSSEALKTLPDFKGVLEVIEKSLPDLPRLTSKNALFKTAFAEVLKAPLEEWQGPEFDDAQWKEMQLPTFWESAGLPDVDGVVWFRKTVEVPEAWAGKEATLSLGPVDDNEITWVNGKKVGETNGRNVPRVYKVPRELVKAGKLTVAVRVVDTGGGGGLYGKPDQMKLDSAGQKPVSLAGAWKYNMNDATAKLPKRPPQNLLGNQNAPTALYNAMIAPLVP